MFDRLYRVACRSNTSNLTTSLAQTQQILKNKNFRVIVYNWVIALDYITVCRSYCECATLCISKRIKLQLHEVMYSLALCNIIYKTKSQLVMLPTLKCLISHHSQPYIVNAEHLTGFVIILPPCEKTARKTLHYVALFIF